MDIFSSIISEVGISLGDMEVAHGYLKDQEKASQEIKEMSAVQIKESGEDEIKSTEIKGSNIEKDSYNERFEDEDDLEIDEDDFELEDDDFELEDDDFELEDDDFELEEDDFELEEDELELEEDDFELEEDDEFIGAEGTDATFIDGTDNTEMASLKLTEAVVDIVKDPIQKVMGEDKSNRHNEKSNGKLDVKRTVDETKYRKDKKESSEVKTEKVKEQPVKNDINYDSLNIEHLYKIVKQFMVRKGVDKQLISYKELNKEFGSYNINRLIKGSYIIKMGKGVTIGA